MDFSNNNPDQQNTSYNSGYQNSYNNAGYQNSSAYPPEQYNSASQQSFNEILLKKRKTRAVISTVFLCLFLIASLAFIVSSVKNLVELEVIDAEDVKYSEFKESTVYYFDELELVDYTSETKYIGENDKYIVRFRDKNDELCYTFISIEYTDDIKDECDDYFADESLQPGDVYLKGCFHGYEQTLRGSQLDYYQRELPGKNVNLCFYYDGENASAYTQEVRSDNLIPLIIFSVMAIIFLILIVFIWKGVNKLKSNNFTSSAIIVNKMASRSNIKIITFVIMAISAVMAFVGIIIFNSGNEIGVLFIVFGIISLIACCSSLYTSSKTEIATKLTREIFPTDEALTAELDRAFYTNGEFRSTPYLICLPGHIVIPKHKLAWVYVHKVKLYGIVTTQISLIIKTTECKSITVNLGDSVNETIFQDMLAKTGNTFYPHTVFGYSHNAINHYNNYKKQYKQTKQQNKG